MNNMNEKILFVDDEENILAAFNRKLRGHYTIRTVNNAQEGLDILMTDGPFAITVADLKMPKMDGIEYFKIAKKVAPDTVRILLTGHADMNTAINAINEGYIFRFLTKPCPSDLLFKTLNFALEQYRLITAERELVKSSLKQCVALMTELLSLSNPTAYNQSIRLRRIVKRINKNLNIMDGWLYELSATLSQIGRIAFPYDILKKTSSLPNSSPDAERNIFTSHPLIAGRLLAGVTRLDDVALIVKNQQRPYLEYAGEINIRPNIQLGAQILKVALGYDGLIEKGNSHLQALEMLQEQADEFNQQVVLSLGQEDILTEVWDAKNLTVEELEVGMIVNEDVYTFSGERVINKTQKISFPLLDKLQILIKNDNLIEPIRVFAPRNSEHSEEETRFMNCENQG